jgi:hypothetical protein
LLRVEGKEEDALRKEVKAQAKADTSTASDFSASSGGVGKMISVSAVTAEGGPEEQREEQREEPQGGAEARAGEGGQRAEASGSTGQGHREAQAQAGMSAVEMGIGGRGAPCGTRGAWRAVSPATAPHPKSVAQPFLGIT